MEKSNELDLEKIGIEVASGWGAECVGYKIKDDKVTFDCIEHGERFLTTPMTIDEIKELYPDLVKQSKVFCSVCNDEVGNNRELIEARLCSSCAEVEEHNSYYYGGY